MNETPLDALEYIASLAMGEAPEEVTKLDGAALWRIADEHFVLLTCAAHTHRGKDLLVRVLPRDWAPFHSAVNPDAGYQAHHYGPQE